MSVATDIKELRKAALLYFDVSGPASGVIESFEEVVNCLYKQNPNDIYGFLANYFEEKALKPKINKISARVCLNSLGLPTASVDVYCNYKNKIKLITTFESPISFQFSPPDPEEIFNERQWIGVNKSVECINCFVSNILTNICPYYQNTVDDIISEYFCKRMNECVEVVTAGESDNISSTRDSNLERIKMRMGEREENSKDAEVDKLKEKKDSETKKDAKKDNSKIKQVSITSTYFEETKTNLPSCMLGVAAVSQAVCIASAQIQNTQLFDHIHYCYVQQARDSYRLTTPIFTIMSSGRNSIGKLKCCKEFLIFAAPNRPMNQVIWEIKRIYNYCLKSLNLKSGLPWSSSEMGSLNATFDKVEQGLDLLEEAIEAIGLKAGLDYYLGINVTAADFYNPDKEKYEPIVGLFKTGIEMSKFWSDLILQYSSLIYIVDPFIKKDQEPWAALCRAVSNRCYVIGQQIFDWANQIRSNEEVVNFTASGIELRMNDFDTVTDIWFAALKFIDACREVILVYSFEDACNSFIIDMAQALGIKFVRVGGLSRGEKTLKINRLLQIRDFLLDQNLACVDKKFVYPKIKCPEPAANPDDNSVQGEQANKKKSSEKKKK